MMKKISSLLLLMGSLAFGQITDLSLHQLKGEPKTIEESNSKAIIRANIIEDYIQEYHTKTTYNTKGFIAKVEHYSSSGDLAFTEEYTYNENGKLVMIEGINPDESLTIIKDYEYFENGYKEITSENDIIVKEINYTLDAQQNIVAEKEIAYTPGEQITERFHTYKDNKLMQTKVVYGKDGHFVSYKYDAKGLCIEEVVTDLKNKNISKKRRKFDDNNNIIEENLYDATGRIKTNHRILYQYDEKGNWNKRTQFANQLEQPISNTLRTIRY